MRNIRSYQPHRLSQNSGLPAIFVDPPSSDNISSSYSSVSVFGNKLKQQSTHSSIQSKSTNGSRLKTSSPSEYKKAWQQFDNINGDQPPVAGSVIRPGVEKTLGTVKFWAPSNYKKILKNKSPAKTTAKVTKRVRLRLAKEEKERAKRK